MARPISDVKSSALARRAACDPSPSSDCPQHHRNTATARAGDAAFGTPSENVCLSF